MIFLAAGTQDGRELAQCLTAAGLPVIISVVSDYGKELIKKDSHLTINDHILDAAALESLLIAQKVKIFIDATHPYAVHISQTAMAVCTKLSITYIRYERPLAALPAYDKLYRVDDYAAAAAKAFALGDIVFLTTGSRHLNEFSSLAAAAPQRRLFARVLPVQDSLAACTAANISPKYTIAMQGPFSEALNRAMYEQCHAQVVVLKNSGRLGGTDTKISAAQKAGLAIVIIERPQIVYHNIHNDYDSILDLCRQSS